MSTQLIAYNDLERIGKVLASSKLFGMKNADEAIALCLIAQAEGKHPATAAQEYHVIQGRPALKADAMLARFQAAGGKVEWKSYTDKEVSGKFSHPQGGSVEILWSIEMAKKLGYDKKDNWQKFPRAMMRARCISEGVRTVYPGIAVGIYTPEEVQDFEEPTRPPMVDVTPSDTDKSKPASPFKTAAARKMFQLNVTDNFHKARNHKELTDLMEMDKPKFLEMEGSGNEADQLSLGEIRKQFQLAWNRLAIATREEQEGSTFDPEEVPPFVQTQIDQERERKEAMGF